MERASDNQYVMLLVLTILNVSLFQVGDLVCRNLKVSRMVMGILIIPSIVIGLIFLYGKYRCTRSHIKDPLELPLSRHVPWFDGWSYSHLLVCFLAGKFIPEGVGFVFLLCLAWELFEFYLGAIRPEWMKHIGGGSCTINTDKHHEGKVWWYGKYTDILVNASGLLLSKVI